MRTLIAILPFLFAFWTQGASPISLEWDPSPDADVVNYRLYWGPVSATYTNHADVGNVTNTVFSQVAGGGHYYFVVTALNAGGAESDPSNEVDYQAPVTPPKRLRITQSLQAAAAPVGPWREVGTLQSLMVEEADAQFYRVKLAIEPPPTP